MYHRSRILGFILVSLSLSNAAMAFGPTNARLRGFGGAGVAVAPVEGQTAMAVNPAAPGLMKQRQFNVNLEYGSGERATHWFRAGEYLDTDSRDLGAGAEFYLPLGPANLFFGLGTELETVEAGGTAWHHHYHGTDAERSTTSIKPHLGLAGNFDDLVSVGGRLLYWHADSTYDLTEGFKFNHDAQLLAGELGILVTTPAGLNFGFTWSTEDGAAERDVIQVGRASFAEEHFFGLPSTLRIGTAYQRKDGSWLAGIEYAVVDDLDLDFVINDQLTFTFPGEKLLTVYGEYWIGDLGLRGSAGLRAMDDMTYDNEYWRDWISPTESDSWLIAAGCTYRRSETVGIDLFLQRVDGDGASQISTFDEDHWRIGFGMTFLN